MATKQIQLRGISRTPSDRLTNDGGCAESLNVQLDNTELAPSFYPDDVTTRRGLPADLEADKIFIHKATSYENYIVVQSDRVIAYTAEIEDEEPLEVLALPHSERVNDIVALGNTLVISTDTKMYYILYKNGSYENISDIPSINPAIYANDVNLTQNTTHKNLAWFTNSVSFENTTAIVLNDEKNNYLITDEGTKTKISALYTKYKELISHNLEIGCFNQPVFIIYATRMYDGSLMNVSSPIMLGGRTKTGYTGDPLQDFPILFIAKEQVVEGTSGRKVNTDLDVFVTNPFVIAVKQDLPENLEKWADIITSLDVFIAPVYNMIPNGEVYAKLGEDWPYLQGDGEFVIKLDPENVENENRQLDALFGSSAYKKVASWTIDQLYKNSEEVEIRGDFRGEALVENEDLFSNDIIYKDILLKELTAYNRKLIGYSSFQKVSTGLPFLNGQHADVNTTETYALEFYLDSPDVPKVFSMTNSNNYFISPDLALGVRQNGNAISLKRFTSNSFAWISFPDKRCKKVVIYKKSGENLLKTEVVMYPHPSIPNTSYAFIGYNKSIATLEYSNVGEMTFENANIEDVTNVLFVSKINNPWGFDEGGKYTFQSKILGVAVATTTLSQGQFGQFPLYVFTEDGIWAMETAADGSFTSQKPLSREVCINPDSITSLDNAVVFVTAQGVMLLQGSQVTNISSFMNGRHYTVEESAKNIINGQKDFKDFIPVVDDETHFMAFMREAKIAYDYAGKRLVFIKEGEAYQYIYKLDTQTWHKSAYGVNLVAPINSYPECLVQGGSKGLRKICWVDFNHWQDGEEYLVEYFHENHFPFLSKEEVFEFLNQDRGVDVTDFSANEINLLMADTSERAVRITFKEEEKTISRVYDLSTILDAAESKTPTKGVIATRPLDLGEPDVFKTITDIRVRGQYPKGAVKFILLGSNDGMKFYTINTLRGKAWKLFRIIILADLQPTDRISWIDVQYETKFTNKLR